MNAQRIHSAAFARNRARYWRRRNCFTHARDWDAIAIERELREDYAARQNIVKQRKDD
jgi:hypothetical protein